MSDRRDSPNDFPSDFPNYDFAPLLDSVGGNWYADDALLRRILERFAPEAVRKNESLLVEFGARAAGPYREWIDRIERAPNLPVISRKDAWDRRHDHVELPAETKRMLADQHGARLAGGELDDFVRYAALFVLAQNGEGGTLCSLACTDGLVRALRELGDDEHSRAALDALLSNTPERWVHGAQFVTEVQGGSDAATNAVRAEAGAPGLYRLYGRKWFCSNCTADYWLVTARPPGAPSGPRGVALFIVPRLRSDGTPNGYSIDRLKDKLGTRALPTAEIDLMGAEGWMLGPPEAGLKNMVAIVLVTSRIFNVLGAAGLLRGAARWVRAYGHFREAFGQRIEAMALVGEAIERIEHESERALAGAFETIALWLAHAPNGRTLGDVAARVHVSLAKAVSTRDAARHIYEAMVLPGGNGIEERFSPLPRLLRDAAIFETWEGPYTLLLMQALGDLVRFEMRGREHEFFEAVWPAQERPEDLVESLRQVLADPHSDKNALLFRDFAHAYYGAYRRAALSHYS